MKVAALIPARKQSRRLPQKNWREVGGHPLWGHAVHHAYASQVCDPLVVSTDDELIQVEVRKYQFESSVVVIEQPQFPQSYNVMLDVVRHADGALQHLGINVDAICLLQPTSPLRTPEDVSKCVLMLASPAVESVVSVTEGADDIAFQVRWAGRLEKLPAIVIPNGAIYAIKTDILRAGGSWYGPHTYAYFMPKERSIDIDNEVDLEMAQAAWGSLNGPRS